MAFGPGVRLGPYEIVDSLGAGGPSFVGEIIEPRQLRRGLAEAKERTR